MKTKIRPNAIVLLDTEGNRWSFDCVTFKGATVTGHYTMPDGRHESIQFPFFYEGNEGQAAFEATHDMTALAEELYQHERTCTCPQCSGQPEDWEPEARRSQAVTLHGDHIGFQFSRTKNGKRTIRARVYDVHLEDDPHIPGRRREFGLVNWRDRKGVRVMALCNGMGWWDTVAN